MPLFICTACGTQYPESAQPPAQCPVCEEERQYVPPGGQGWTTLDKLQATCAVTFQEQEPGILSIGSDPSFAIGQRALLVQTKGGNVLWDCIAPMTPAAITLLKSLGGVTAMAISHPHFYTTMIEWSRALGGVPIHIHVAEKDWVRRPDPCVNFWDGETKKLWDGVTLVRCGGHFEGGQVMHWAGGAGGKGVVCAGDILTVATDRKWLTFMRSYPNFIPLSEKIVRGIGAALEPFAFETVYGHYFDRVITPNAKDVLRKSVDRYVAAIRGERGYG